VNEKVSDTAWQNIETAESEFLIKLADEGDLAPFVAGMLRHCARLLASLRAEAVEAAPVDGMVSVGNALDWLETLSRSWRLQAHQERSAAWLDRARECDDVAALLRKLSAPAGDILKLAKDMRDSYIRGLPAGVYTEADWDRCGPSEHLHWVLQALAAPTSAATPEGWPRECSQCGTTIALGAHDTDGACPARESAATPGQFERPSAFPEWCDHPARFPKGTAATPGGQGEWKSRFFIDHGMVHDRKTGKHLVGMNAAGETPENLLAVLHELEVSRDAWRMTAKTVDVATALAQPVASAAPGAGTWAYEMIMRVNDLCRMNKAIPESGAERVAAMEAFTNAHRQLFDELTAALAHPKPDGPRAGGEYPMQPLLLDQHGRVRFRENTLVRHLLDKGGLTMNDLAVVECPVEEREQFAQLIGYSLDGFGELSYVTDETYARAEGATPTPADETGGVG
jgi:hypothetical protein